MSAKGRGYRVSGVGCRVRTTRGAPGLAERARGAGRPVTRAPKPDARTPIPDGSFDPAEISARLLKRAETARGVDQAEAYVSQNIMTIARIETLRHGTTVVGPNAQQAAVFSNMEACVRVVKNGAVGTAATIYLDERSLNAAVDEAAAVARIMTPDPNLRSLARPTGSKGPRIPPDPKILGGDVTDALMDKAEEAACCFPRGIDLAGSIIAVSEVFSVRNSNGISVERGEDTLAVAQLTAERVDGGEVLSSGAGWGASRLLDRLDSLGAARRALELAVLEPDLRTVPEGNYDVILGPYSVADIMDHMLVPQLGMAQIYSGTSWLPADRSSDGGRTALRRPKLGEAIASPQLTIREQPHLKDAMGSKAFDDEGLPTRPRALVERGIWKGVIANSYYAYLYGLEPSGNGFRSGPRPGRMASAGIGNSPTNIVMEPGDMTLDEMVKQCGGPALYVPRTWYTYPTRYGASGFSSSNRSTAFLIKNGEMVPVAPNAFKLLGDVATVLRDIKGIGKDVSTATTWAAGFCSIVPHVMTGGIRVEKPAE
jgi:predicted Zn-dependent protease